ncbi:MAG: hypothetical protein JWM27_2099 [Gemmatimonadetes bacterium]|nr:hypothetical protein [Gemmatimonadota bacterium]
MTSITRRVTRVFVVPMLLAAAPVLRAQDTTALRSADSLLVRALVTHAMPVRLADGRLSGAGADFLIAEGGRSQFFLIGEDHGMRELPQLSAALFRALRPAGYAHLAVEVGPLSAERLEATLRTPGGLDAWGRAVRADPWAVAFDAWREETQMAADAVAATGGRRGTIWGLDQEFIGAPAGLLRRLAAIAPNAAARALAQGYAADAVRADARVIAEKNPTIYYMTSAPADMSTRLTAAFRPGAGSEAARIIDELRVSREIYAGQFDGHGYESNDQRAGLMKRHFMERYRAARAAGEAAPRVLVKLGGYHSIRGRSYTGVFDVGNLLSEMAASGGARSFHLFVLTAHGTRNAFLPFAPDNAEKAHALNVAEDLDFMDARPLLAAGAPDAWTVLDLRPLRGEAERGRLGRLNPGLRTLMWGYDAVLVIPEAHASTLWIDVPPR